MWPTSEFACEVWVPDAAGNLHVFDEGAGPVAARNSNCVGRGHEFGDGGLACFLECREGVAGDAQVGVDLGKDVAGCPLEARLAVEELGAFLEFADLAVITPDDQPVAVWPGVCLTGL